MSEVTSPDLDYNFIAIITNHCNLEYFKNPNPSINNNFNGWNNSHITTMRSLTNQETRTLLPMHYLIRWSYDLSNQTRTFPLFCSIQNTSLKQCY